MQFDTKRGREREILVNMYWLKTIYIVFKLNAETPERLTMTS